MTWEEYRAKWMNAPAVERGRYFQGDWWLFCDERIISTTVASKRGVTDKQAHLSFARDYNTGNAMARDAMSVLREHNFGEYLAMVALCEEVSQ